MVCHSYHHSILRLHSALREQAVDMERDMHEIWDLIKSVSEGFLTYSSVSMNIC